MAAISRQGIAAAAAVYLLLALAWSIVTPAQWGTDESSNLAYGHHLAHGRWPTIDHPKADVDLPGLDARLRHDARIGAGWRSTIWTAHHPPLYYALAGAAFRSGDVVSGAAGGMLAARLLTVAGGFFGVLATGWLAVLMLPSRPHVAVLASGVAALTPTLPHYAGQVYADAMVFALCTVAFAIMAIIVRDGPTDRSVLALGGLWTLLALTRSTGAIVVATGTLVVAGWWVLRGRDGAERPRWRPTWVVWTAAVGALAVGLSPYAVNLSRYGEPIGSQTVIAAIGRTPGSPWITYLVDPSRWLLPLDLLLLEISSVAEELLHDAIVWWKLSLVWSLLLALIVGVDRLRHRPIAPHCLLPLAAQGGGAVVLFLLSANWLSRGGQLHARYYFPVLALLALGVAYGCAAAARWRVAAAATIVAGLVGATVNLFWLLRASAARIAGAPEELPTLVAHPWPSAAVLLALAGLAVARLLQCYAHACRADDPRHVDVAAPPLPLPGR